MTEQIKETVKILGVTDDDFFGKKANKEKVTIVGTHADIDIYHFADAVVELLRENRDTEKFAFNFNDIVIRGSRTTRPAQIVGNFFYKDYLRSAKPEELLKSQQDIAIENEQFNQKVAELRKISPDAKTKDRGIIEIIGDVEDDSFGVREKKENEWKEKATIIDSHADIDIFRFVDALEEFRRENWGINRVAFNFNGIVIRAGRHDTTLQIASLFIFKNNLRNTKPEELPKLKQDIAMAAEQLKQKEQELEDAKSETASKRVK